jgi:hypothetical protein
MPAVIADDGDDATNETLKFFTARIPNPNTYEVTAAPWRGFCR